MKLAKSDSHNLKQMLISMIASVHGHILLATVSLVYFFSIIFELTLTANLTNGILLYD